MFSSWQIVLFGTIHGKIIYKKLSYVALSQETNVKNKCLAIFFWWYLHRKSNLFKKALWEKMRLNIVFNEVIALYSIFFIFFSFPSLPVGKFGLAKFSYSKLCKDYVQGFYKDLKRQVFENAN